MSDEPTIEMRAKNSAGRTAMIVLSPWFAVLLATGAAVYVRGNDLERLIAVDTAGQRRSEVNRNRIDGVELRQIESERDARAGRDRIIRLEVATENQAKSLDKIETGVERLNVKVDEIRRKAQ